MGQIQAQVEFQLVISRLHVATELVKRLVVIFLFQVCQLVHGDHFQEIGRRIPEQGGDADFRLGL